MKARRRRAPRREMRHWIRPAAVLLCLIVGAVARAETPAGCVSLDVPAPFILPDGTVHAAAPLRLCLDDELNPVTGLHRIYVRGQPAGYALSRVSTPEAPVNSGPYAVFRADRGRLRLAGYAVAYDGRTYLYRLREPRVAPGAVSATKRAGRADAPVTEPSSTVVLAARAS